MELLLLSMSAHMTKELGMAPGGEFRQAVKEVFILCVINYLVILSVYKIIR